MVWREGVVWLFTVGANNFCKSISFCAWNIKRSRERYIKARSIFANRNHANQFVSFRFFFFFSVSLSFFVLSFFFFYFNEIYIYFFGDKLLFYTALFFNVFFAYAGINIIALRVNS